MSGQQVAERRADPITVFRQTLETSQSELKRALPSHIPVDRFMRVATSAVQASPDLLDPNKVERRSLFGALVRAAQDGLLPDGREGAIVPFKGKAQWMPMVAGIMKKVRNSGEISDWFVSAVYERDEIEVLRGDDNRIFHKPYLEGDPGNVIGAYSIVTFRDGSKSRDYMPAWRIERVRATLSDRQKSALQWTTFKDEGYIKTVIRHHAKRLPQSTDVEAAFTNDLEVGAPEKVKPALELVTAPVSRLDAIESRIIADNAESEIPPLDPLESGRANDDHGESHNAIDVAPWQAKVDGWLERLGRAELSADVTAVDVAFKAESEFLPDDVAAAVQGAIDGARGRIGGGK